MKSCTLKFVYRRRGRDKYKCSRCRRIIKVATGAEIVAPICKKSRCRRKKKIVSPSGAGTELKAILAKFGITDQAGCGCGSHAAMMDAYGTKWCWDNLEQIVTWLVDEGKKRGWLFAPRWGARRLVKKAIRNAERKAKETGK